MTVKYLDIQVLLEISNSLLAMEARALLLACQIANRLGPQGQVAPLRLIENHTDVLLVDAFLRREFQIRHATTFHIRYVDLYIYIFIYVYIYVYIYLEIYV